MGKEGEKVLSVRSSTRCPPSHAPTQTRAACGHGWCPVCSGFVDPTTRVIFSRPNPTITCNRKPQPWESYALLFRETGCGREHFTTCMKKALGASRVVAFRNLYKLKEWENLMTPSGWDRVKKEAKERKVLFEHYSPPWGMVRKHSAVQNVVWGEVPAGQDGHEPAGV